MATPLNAPLRNAILINTLQGHLARFPKVLIGHTSMMDDPTVLLVDYTGVEAVAGVSMHCAQFHSLSKTRGALLTDLAQKTWASDVSSTRTRLVQ